MILEANQIYKSYKNTEAALTVLQGIDIKIETGDIVSIIGPSGAGKSTLLHILGGLDAPDKGTIVLEGEKIYDMNDADRAKIRNEKIGFVFQFYHLLPEFTALENVILPAIIRDGYGMKDLLRHKGESILERVGLEERMKHKPYQLSGGEQQRVAIARALINEPRIIFCDEPTGNLDSNSGEEIINLLMELNEVNQQTFVIVTHQEEIANISHRTIPMRDGKLIESLS